MRKEGIAFAQVEATLGVLSRLFFKSEPLPGISATLCTQNFANATLHDKTNAKKANEEKLRMLRSKLQGQTVGREVLQCHLPVAAKPRFHWQSAQFVRHASGGKISGFDPGLSNRDPGLTPR